MSFSCCVIYILIMQIYYKQIACFGMIMADMYTLIRNDTNNTNKLAAAVNYFFHEDKKINCNKNLCVLAIFYL